MHIAEGINKYPGADGHKQAKEWWLCNERWAPTANLSSPYTWDVSVENVTPHRGVRCVHVRHVARHPPERRMPSM